MVPNANVLLQEIVRGTATELQSVHANFRITKSNISFVIKKCKQKCCHYKIDSGAVRLV